MFRVSHQKPSVEVKTSNALPSTVHYNQGDFDLFTYLNNPEVFEVKEGMIDLLTAPGLGIEINEELVRKCAEEHKDFSWRNPIFRGRDGGVREW